MIPKCNRIQFIAAVKAKYQNNEYLMEEFFYLNLTNIRHKTDKKDNFISNVK